MLHHAEGAAEERFGSGRAKADDHARFDERDLVLEPRVAGTDFARIRRLVDATLRARVLGPLEVLDRVRYVDVVAIDARGVECMIEQAS